MGDDGMTPMRINGEYFLVDAVLAEAIVTKAEGYRAEIDALRAENAALKDELDVANQLLMMWHERNEQAILGNWDAHNGITAATYAHLRRDKVPASVRAELLADLLAAVAPKEEPLP